MELRRFPPGPINDDLRFPADLVDDDLRKTCRENQPPPATFSENLRARCEVSARSTIFAPGTRSYRVFCRAAFTAIEIEPFPFDGRCHRWIELRLVTAVPIDLGRRESGSMYGGGDGASPPANAAEAAHPMTTRAAGTAASPTVPGSRPTDTPPFVMSLFHRRQSTGPAVFGTSQQNAIRIIPG